MQIEIKLPVLPHRKSFRVKVDAHWCKAVRKLVLQLPAVFVVASWRTSVPRLSIQTLNKKRGNLWVIPFPKKMRERNVLWRILGAVNYGLTLLILKFLCAECKACCV